MKRLLAILLAATGPGFSLPAFPGAEGWGADTPGGRGGRVITVTNLNDDGPGSLRAALLSTGPRIIVFRVSGVINLNRVSGSMGHLDLDPGHSGFTLAGQTSPGGVTITSNSNAITGSYREDIHDFIMRFLRFRVTVSGGGIDAAEFNGARNFIIDHVDFSGGSDECFSITSSHHWTLQWSTIANSTPLGGDHGGSLFAYAPTSRITIHHNLWAHHQERVGGLFHWGDVAPPDRGLIDYRNNVCYNAEALMLYIDQWPQIRGPLDFNCVNNYFKDGPARPDRTNPSVILSAPFGDVYDGGNIWQGMGKQPLQWDFDGSAASPHPMPAVETQPALTAYDLVLTKAGAWPRDSMNIRTVQEVRSGTGAMRNDRAPWIEGGPEPPADADMDGMPDFWEEAMGFDKNDYGDNTGDHDGDGYTNIEEYINDLALARLCEDYYNPVYPIPSNWPDYNPDCNRSVAVEGGTPVLRHPDGASEKFRQGAGIRMQPLPVLRIHPRSGWRDFRGRTLGLIPGRIPLKGGA